MNILVVGNIVKDVYLNLDHRTESFEKDGNHTDWLNLSFDGSKHYFFSRVVNYGGAAVSLETLQKLGLAAQISGSNLSFEGDDSIYDAPDQSYSHRYILIHDEAASYFAPSTFAKTTFTPPLAPVDYLYLDRSAELDQTAKNQILNFLNSHPETKLVLYVRDLNSPITKSLIPQATLIFSEFHAPELNFLDTKKIVYLSSKTISYAGVSVHIHPQRIDVMTHLSLYSVAAATILGAFILGETVEKSLEFARLNVENSRLNSSLSLSQLYERCSRRI